MPRVEHRIIDPSDPLYEEAVRLRYEVFFRPTNTPMDRLHDALETRSIHAVALSNGHLAGYARLTPQGREAIFSQFVVEPGHRGVLAVAVGLFELMRQEAARHGADQVVADVRLPGVRAFRRYGFDVVGDVFPSKKTGIPHVRMCHRLTFDPREASDEKR